MPGIDPTKFRVLKKRIGTERTDGYEELEEGSFFVLRNHDLASLAALRGYAQGLLLIMDVHGAQMDPEDREHIQALFDDVSTLADKWERSEPRHLPN